MILQIKQTLRILVIYGFLGIFTMMNIFASESGGIGQSIKALRLKKLAINADKIGDIYTATDYYDAYVQIKKNDYKTTYHLAELYRISRNYKKALEFYKIVYDCPDTKSYPLSLYYYATMQKMLGEYNEAIASYVKFGKEYKGHSDDKYYKNLSRAEVNGCDLAKSYIDTVWNKAKNKVIVTHLDTSINKANIEFSPVPIDEKSIIYASMKSDTVPYYYRNDTAKKPTRKFYVAYKKGNEWTGGQLYPGPFNNAEYDVGNGSISPDRKSFYFTYCTKNWKNSSLCDIYVSRKDSDDFWGAPQIMPSPINMSGYSSTMPTIGTDSRTKQEVIYFISDRPNGVGGYDIWFSAFNKKKKEWGEVKNAGKLVNTPGDEITPFYDNSNRTMYFSSDKLPGFGGQDIYKTIGEQRNWTRPENLGFPINSSTDDMYYVNSRTQGEGFFTSNRAGGVTLNNNNCCDDLYTFQSPALIKIVARGTLFAVKDSSLFQALTKTDVSEFVNIDKSKIDTQAVSLLGGKLVSLFLVKENTKDSVFISSTATNSKGEYFLNLDQGNNYIIRIENYGYDNKRLKVGTYNILKSDTIQLDAIYMKVIADNKGQILKDKQAIVMRNITYEYGKSDLTPETKKYLDGTIYATMIQMPKIIIEISAHTDSIGTDASNMKLSQKRAENVVNYLVSKGIEKNRLRSKGYGEAIPIAPNTNKDGTDNPPGREKNRRTEFKILGSTDQYLEME